MKKQILWLAPYVPYSKVRHAGGKNMNYYLNYINNTGEFDITFIGLAYEEERKDVDLEQRGIKSDIYYRDHSRADYIVRRIVSGFTLLNPWTRYYRQLLLYEHIQLSNRVRKYKAAGGNPDIVILHWTSMGLLLPEWKELFPSAKFIIIEEDVTYLGYQRKYEANPTASWKRLYNGLKQAELTAIKNCDLAVTLNQKDTNLLIRDGINKDKIYTCALYYEDYSDVQRKPIPGKLLYYGAMDRVENYESVIDFIENVMPLLKDENCTLDVVGSKPHPRLIAAADKYNAQLSGSPINITGFVEDIKPYLSEAMCLVAPLKLGAGIKVKVLEAMSAGVPVLTNNIGIEGIYAEDRKDYLHCETKEEYRNAIIDLAHDTHKTEAIGTSGKTFIAENFNIDMKLQGLCEIILGFK
ncbi:glycosyltransferase [Butyrivibrio sp. FC2001]|uniref:glycosyltransferase n=1 Tax=Butyrivibrio sp. FC2001 TaxID=1280671 RepID=UPI0009DBE3BA|nr:glycosyltransferase [Butyrivibrio sp. FC2001]